MRLYGFKNEYGGVKSGLSDPVNPQGPILEDQGPWKFGVMNFFDCIPLSDVPAFIWDPNLDNWTLNDPPRPPPPKKKKKPTGDPGGNPHNLSNIGQTCVPILILSIGLQIWMFEVVLHKNLKLLLKKLTSPDQIKVQCNYFRCNW
jgi:hypothetical protein